MFSPSLSNIPYERLYRVGITGASTATPTKRAGHGVTVTRTAIGVLRFSFDLNPGTFVEIAGPVFRANTPSDVKGYSISGGAPVAQSGATSAYIEVSLWDASNAAVDLTSVQYLDVTFAFSEKSDIS